MKMSVVLIIDDNRADQYLTKAIVENYDPTIKILQAYDGQQALEIIKEIDEAIDVIFLDINMPGMNGFEFLEEYSKRSDQIAVSAMLTSSEQCTDRERSMSYECVKAFFVKPVDASDLESIAEL